MRVYEQEEKDGVGDLLREGRVLAWTAPARIIARANSLPTSVGTPTTALATNLDQPDLYYLESVLVTAGLAIDSDRDLPYGWNGNDHVFDPLEVWVARTTPEDKPFNFSHDCSDIIGHITDVGSETIAGEAIATDSTSVPDAYHLITKAVLYRRWADKDLQERMDRLLAEIPEGKWHVSMECLYADFDFALLGRDGSLEVLERSRETAHLTKHLRICKGSGSYQGKRLGMVLRDLIFSGKGLVENPANPKSVIRASLTTSGVSNADSDKLPANNAEKTQPVYSKTEPNHRESTTMTEEQLKAENARLQAALDKAQASLASLDQAKLAEAQKERDQALASLAQEKAARAELEKASAAATAQVKAEVEKVVAEKADLQKKLTEAEASLQALARDKAKAERLAKVAPLGLDAEKAQKMVESLAALDDAAFAAHLELLLSAQAAGGVKVLQTPTTSVGTHQPATNVGTHKPAVAGKDNADPTILDKVTPDKEPALATAGEPEGEARKGVRLALARMLGYQPEDENATATQAQ